MWMIKQHPQHKEEGILCTEKCSTCNYTKRLLEDKSQDTLMAILAAHQATKTQYPKDLTTGQYDSASREAITNSLERVCVAVNKIITNASTETMQEQRQSTEKHKNRQQRKNQYKGLKELIEISESWTSLLPKIHIRSPQAGTQIVSKLAIRLIKHINKLVQTNPQTTSPTRS